MSYVYKSVIKPKKILFVASYLLAIEGVFFIALALLTKSGAITLAFLMISHTLCVHLSNKEPHINNILRNYYYLFLELCGAKDNHINTMNTKTLYKDETREYFEL